jgi:hypothetical protein
MTWMNIRTDIRAFVGKVINFGKIAKCLAKKGCCSKIYIGEDLPGQDYWIIGLNHARMEEKMNGNFNF